MQIETDVFSETPSGPGAVESTRELRILLVDDHEMVRRGLRSMLETNPAWHVCGEGLNGHEAIALAETLQPDLIIMDITMPELDGAEATRRIVKMWPCMQVLILTMHESEVLILTALAAGARGFVLKSETGHCLVEAVAAMGRGEVFYTSRIGRIVWGEYHADPRYRLPGDRQLTSRESEILRHIAEGLSNKEIAEKLNIRVHTATRHRSNIMNKLGLHSISELVRYAIRNHLIEA